MDERTCPQCGEVMYSAVSQEDWDCINCGCNVPASLSISAGSPDAKDKVYWKQVQYAISEGAKRVDREVRS